MEITLHKWLQKALSSDSYEELRTGKPLELSRHKTTKLLNEPRKMDLATMSKLYLFCAKQPTHTTQIPKFGTVMYTNNVGADIVPHSKYMKFYIELHYDGHIEQIDNK